MGAQPFTLDQIIKTTQYDKVAANISWLLAAVYLYTYTLLALNYFIGAVIACSKNRGIWIIVTHVPPDDAAHKLRLLNGHLAGLSSPPDCGELGGSPLGVVYPVLQETLGITIGQANRELALLKGGTMGQAATWLVLTMVFGAAAKGTAAATVALLSMYLGETGLDWYNTMIIIFAILAAGTLYDLLSIVYTIKYIQTVMHWCNTGDVVLQARRQAGQNIDKLMFNSSSGAETEVYSYLENHKKNC